MSKQFIIFKENGIYKGTPLENYNAQIRDANQVLSFPDFNSPEECKEYLLTYATSDYEILIKQGEQ